MNGRITCVCFLLFNLEYAVNARSLTDLVSSHSLLRVDRPLALGIAESLHAKAGAVLCAVDTLLQLLHVDAVIRVSGSVRCAHHGTHNGTQIACFVCSL
jgi:hypothetical protein